MAMLLFSLTSPLDKQTQLKIYFLCKTCFSTQALVTCCILLQSFLLHLPMSEIEYTITYKKVSKLTSIFKGIFLKLIDSYQQRRQLSYGVSSNSNPSKKIETTSQSFF